MLAEASGGGDAEALALIYAFRGNVPSLRSLLVAGVDFRVRDEEGRTPLILAARHRHLPAMELIVGVSCLIDAEDQDGRTAMHYAIVWQSLPAVQLLLAHGARIHGLFGPHRNETLLHTVVRSETTAAAPLLEYFVCALGCDPFYCPPPPPSSVTNDLVFSLSMSATYNFSMSATLHANMSSAKQPPFETPYALARRLGRRSAIVLNNYGLNRVAWLSKHRDRIEERCTGANARTALTAAPAEWNCAATNFPEGCEWDERSRLGGVTFAINGFPLWGADDADCPEELSGAGEGAPVPHIASGGVVVPVASHPLLDRMNVEWYHDGLHTAVGLADSF
jgi:hypothetical protein